MKNLKGIGLLLLANLLIFVTLSITVPILINFVLPMCGRTKLIKIGTVGEGFPPKKWLYPFPSLG